MVNHQDWNKTSCSIFSSKTNIHLFIYIDVTRACESERAHVLTDKISNSLIIADRGYVSVELEKKINESNNYFIIKGKSNTTGNIDAAFSSNSQFPNLTNQKLKDVEIKETMDFDITSKHYRLNNDSVMQNNNVTQTDKQSSNEIEEKNLVWVLANAVLFVNVI